MKLPLKTPVFGAFIHISVESPAEFKIVLRTLHELGCLGRGIPPAFDELYMPCP